MREEQIEPIAVSIAGAAKRLGVGASTIRCMIQYGRLPHPASSGGLASVAQSVSNLSMSTRFSPPPATGHKRGICKFVARPSVVVAGSQAGAPVSDRSRVIHTAEKV
jgi:excisionase family DNA binding protein